MATTASTRETFYIPLGTGVYVRASLSKSVYTGAIGTAAGMSATAPTTGDIISARPSNVLNGRVIASGKNSTGKRRSFRIMCPTEKIEEVMTAAKTETIDGFKIDMVRSPRKVVYV